MSKSLLLIFAVSGSLFWAHLIQIAWLKFGYADSHQTYQEYRP